MSLVRVVNESRRCVLGERIRLADTLVTRLRGFLFRGRPAIGEGLLLVPCRGVHMYGMRYPLDILFIDETGVVVGAVAALAPGRRTAIYRAARYALELPEGAISATSTEVGDRLSWMPSTIEGKAVRYGDGRRRVAS